MSDSTSQTATAPEEHPLLTGLSGTDRAQARAALRLIYRAGAHLENALEGTPAEPQTMPELLAAAGRLVARMGGRWVQDPRLKVDVTHVAGSPQITLGLDQRGAPVGHRTQFLAAIAERLGAEVSSPSRYGIQSVTGHWEGVYVYAQCRVAEAVDTDD